MLVNLSIILCDTGLRLRCQQMATHIVTVLGCVHVALIVNRCTALDESYPVSTVYYVLVPLSLNRPARRSETQPLYYIKTQLGVLRPVYVV